MSKLSERVREARNLCSLTQEALASDLGVTRSAVAQWEMEQGTKPSVENLIALARRTGMAFEYLSTGRGKPDCGKPISSISEPTPTYQNSIHNKSCCWNNLPNSRRVNAAGCSNCWEPHLTHCADEAGT